MVRFMKCFLYYLFHGCCCFSLSVKLVAMPPLEVLFHKWYEEVSAHLLVEDRAEPTTLEFSKLTSDLDRVRYVLNMPGKAVCFSLYLKAID